MKVIHTCPFFKLQLYRWLILKLTEIMRPLKGRTGYT